MLELTHFHHPNLLHYPLRSQIHGRRPGVNALQPDFHQAVTQYLERRLCGETLAPGRNPQPPTDLETRCEPGRKGRPRQSDEADKFARIKAVSRIQSEPE